MPTVLGHQDDVVAALPPNQCWAKWRHDLSCPNDWTHAIENIKRPGFMKVCEQHMHGFMQIVIPQQVVVYTKDEWIALDREAAIMQAIKDEAHAS